MKSGGQSLNQLAELPVENQLPGAEFPDGDILDVEPEVWKMYFDGASSYHNNGVGIVFKTPCGEYIPISIKLDFSCTNNEAVNKTLKVIMQKMIWNHRDWHEKLP